MINLKLIRMIVSVIFFAFTNLLYCNRFTTNKVEYYLRVVSFVKSEKSGRVLWTSKPLRTILPKVVIARDRPMREF
jgi:hypothetical protein